MSDFIARRPVWSLVIIFAVGILVWLVFSVWTPGLEAVLGRKRVFLSALFNGITLGALYFLVASGFTLIFGLMRNVNLAHGSLYLFGGYLGYSVGNLTGSWLLALLAAFIVVGVVGVLMQVLLFRWMEGQDLRQTLVTIGLSIIFADLLLWNYGGDTFQVTAPDWLSGPVQLPFVVALRGNGEAVMMIYPFVRIAILIGAIIVGVLMWLALNRTRVGMLVRAGVDDRDMLSATGVRVQLVFVMIFAFGAGLAGLAGVIGGTFQSLQPGEDTKILLSSLVVVIVGGMGSIPGAAIGALIVGLAEQFGSVYMPTYAVMLTFIIMVAVLAVRPQGLAARR
ncbi:branched-chain amino acid ABC transporter permease [Bosea vaviloviae]|uniref:ABC transporter ATP-binding protein n=1 Tax=Bosea vaviloviae TaxID=1526658 RepID=A0A1D7TX30_9HYPH|nr:branched-chain amino acid ABC transporter permease [Bosea vaviloviae]AOO79680.1 ABC transporter ATP-binding protein [Bosea vaviloviae]